MPRREWSDDDREAIEHAAELGRTQRETAALLGLTPGQLGGFAARNGIEFPRKRTLGRWSQRRRQRHKIAMRQAWARRSGYMQEGEI